MTVSYSLGRQMCVWENFEMRPKPSMSIRVLAVFCGCMFLLLWESTFKKANQQLTLSSVNGQSGLHCFTFMKLFLWYGFYSGHHIQSLSAFLTEGRANLSSLSHSSEAALPARRPRNTTGILAFVLVWVILMSYRIKTRNLFKGLEFQDVHMILSNITHSFSLISLFRKKHSSFLLS